VEIQLIFEFYFTFGKFLGNLCFKKSISKR